MRTLDEVASRVGLRADRDGLFRGDHEGRLAYLWSFETGPATWLALGVSLELGTRGFAMRLAGRIDPGRFAPSMDLVQAPPGLGEARILATDPGWARALLTPALSAIADAFLRVGALDVEDALVTWVLPADHALSRDDVAALAAFAHALEAAAQRA